MLKKCLDHIFISKNADLFVWIFIAALFFIDIL